MDFAGLLKRTMGLDAASVGASAVERAVKQRQAACRLPDPAAYWERVTTSPAELQDLIEAVVVPETWFFRDREAFAAVARIIELELRQATPGRVLRLLSLPCSTGEEPYSLAMLLLDAGVPPERFRVDAIDISAHALARARAGVYGKNSFRGNALDFRDRHFRPSGGKWEINSRVRRQVQFQGGNLLDPAFLPGTAVYDVIFCRNVLIYFDRPTQDNVVTVLRRLLTPRGYVFVGPSETSLLLDHAFTSARIPHAFAFYSAPKSVSPASKKSGPRFTAPRRATPPPFPKAPPPKATPPAKPSSTAALDEANRLADSGRLAEAANLYEAHLQHHGPSAEVLYLLGVVRDAEGNAAEASELYRRALYLDPKHQEALLHLAWLREKSGDAAGAKVLTERARRVQPKARA